MVRRDGEAGCQAGAESSKPNAVKPTHPRLVSILQRTQQANNMGDMDPKEDHGITGVATSICQHHILD